MDIKGLWRMVSFRGLNEKTMEIEWIPNKELKELPDDSFLKMFADLTISIEDDHILIMIPLAIPEGVTQEQIDAAVEVGEIMLIDGKPMRSEKHELKFEDGQYLIDSGERGTVFDEPINPWKPVEEDGNTLILMNTYQVVRFGEVPSSIRKTVKEVKPVNAETSAAAGTYIGKYTYFVGSPEDKKTDEPFKLVLNADRTGTQYRNDLEIKISDWSLEGDSFKMTESFLGTIDYTGTLQGSTLTLFNGDPANNFTCAYVYEKE